MTRLGQGILVVTLIAASVGCSTAASAKDKDKDKQKEPEGLSTLVTSAPPQVPFDDLGFLYFSQEKETSVFGSDTQASLKAAVKQIEERARALGADKVVGFTIIVGPPGEFRFISYGTAVKWKQAPTASAAPTDSAGTAR